MSWIACVPKLYRSCAMEPGLFVVQSHSANHWVIKKICCNSNCTLVSFQGWLLSVVLLSRLARADLGEAFLFMLETIVKKLAKVQKCGMNRLAEWLKSWFTSLQRKTATLYFHFCKLTKNLHIMYSHYYYFFKMLKHTLEVPFKPNRILCVCV